ncbi:spore germination protein GerPE [Amphibacillus cookii]|uniref:spore germination protein GerPE n=1 Tax=Amphibacillus cookii TaxID=767787 RepID=UPI00195BC844|nr:spore germination protein GerPE [Amphibacillus cookii]MBM7540144.1 spore germination protein PE [Amphibacillus cookii]
MTARTAHVNSIRIIGIASSAIANIGDCKVSQPYSREIAVQKIAGITGEEAEQYGDYGIFSRKNPRFVDLPNQPIRIINDRSDITVDTINILGVNSSSHFQIGQCDRMRAETRIKHIRYV